MLLILAYSGPGQKGQHGMAAIKLESGTLRVAMPRQIGKYEIVRTLGQGAMGEVYLGLHPAMGRDVAIKTILPAAARG